MTSRLSQDIPIAPGLVFRPGETPFASPLRDGVGSEFFWGGMRLSALDILQPHNHVFILPVVDHLSLALIVANLARAESMSPFHLHFDWPEALERLHPQLTELFPAALAAVTPNTATQGKYSREGLALQEALHKKPLYLMHATEPRRLFLRLCGSSKGLRCHGGISSAVQWPYLTGHAPETSSIPGELLLENGLLPWMGSLFQEELLPDSAFSPQSFLDDVLRFPAETHLLVASPESLKPLLDTLEDLLSQKNAVTQIELRGRALRDGDITRLPSPSRPLALCRVSNRTLAEFSPTRAFAELHLLKLISDKAKIHAWRESFSTSFAGAFQCAAERYGDWTKLSIHQAQERDYFRFVHRLCRESGRLTPTPFDILLAAQATVDSNFSYEFLKECEDFPSLSDSQVPLLTRFSEVELSLAEVAPHVTTFSIERFDTLQRKRMGSLRSVKKKLSHQQTPSHPVAEGKYTDDSWVHSDHPYSCSFPDEDIFMEDFAFHYRAQATEMLRSREQRSREMDTSLGDGLDIRTTVRHWHEEKIFIHEDVTLGKADVGAVVFQFVEPEEEKNYPWVSYWLAEKHDKSDLMFYATPFADNVIGPGVAKSEFGGFAVIPIPNFLAESPWGHPFIAQRKPSESLLVAAAAATDHRAILYIAQHPPGQEVTNLLKRSGKSIIFMKLDELPADKIRHLRTFHILAEAGVRAYAHKYIRKE